MNPFGWMFKRKPNPIPPDFGKDSELLIAYCENDKKDARIKELESDLAAVVRVCATHGHRKRNRDERDWATYVRLRKEGEIK